MVAGSLWARRCRVQTADGSLLACHLLQHREYVWEVLPANTGTIKPTGSHPGLLNKFYVTYKMCRIELCLAELVIYESEQIETYLEFWTPVWTLIITSDGKITLWETCSVKVKQSASPVSEESFDRLFLKCSWNILPWYLTPHWYFRQAASISAKLMSKI